MRNIFEYHNEFDKYANVKSLLQYGDISKCSSPLMSVVMPIYGHPNMFIHSYLSVKNQDADFSFEIVIVDNTPIDGRKSDVLTYLETEKPDNVFYYRNEDNIGMTGNWNRGILLSRAPILTFCHDDDMLFPDCLSKLMGLHKLKPGVFIIPQCKIIDEDIKYPLKDDRQSIKGIECVKFGKIDIFMGNPTNGVGCLFYREHVMNLGGYNEDYYPSPDNALHIKLVFKYGAIRYRRQLYCYRITESNLSNSIYKSFISNGVFYCKCMLPHMGGLYLFKKMLIHAFETRITAALEKDWAKTVEPTLQPSIMDRIVYKILYYRDALKYKGII